MTKLIYTIIFIGAILVQDLNAANCITFGDDDTYQMCIVITPKGETPSTQNDPFD